MKDLITVIIPIYNVEKFLEKCINSVIDQTYNNLEIILVNDGSTDKSGGICDKYKKIDSRVKVIHKNNGGLSDARNVGIDKSLGDYIVFFDSDDWMDKEYISTLYILSQKYNSDITVGNFKKVYNENTSLNNTNNEYVLSNVQALNLIYDNKTHALMIIACNKLFKRHLFKNKRFPVNKIHEDEFLIPELLFISKKIVYTDKEIFHYRQVETSITNSKISIKKLDYIEALSNRREFLKLNNLKDTYIKNENRYMSMLISLYFQFKESDVNNKDKIVSLLKNKILITARESYIEFSLKNKVRYIIFRLFPKLNQDLIIQRIKGVKCFTQNKLCR